MGATFKDTFDLVRITGAPSKKEEVQKTSSSVNSTGCFAPPIRAPDRVKPILPGLLQRLPLPSIGQVLEVAVFLLGLDSGLG